MAKPLAIIREAVEIKVPLITSKKLIFNPFRVTVGSLKQHRNAVFKIAQFFKREFHYDFVQYGYDGNEKDINHVAFLWVHPEAEGLSDKFRVPCIGATCFRWREWTDHPAGWAMQWIWFHPYHRRRGLLTKAWPKFKEEFGDFICESPLSDAMKMFLKRIET